MDVGFIGDNVAQLHKGNTCFIYIEEQIEEIRDLLLKKYKEKLDVKQVEDYWELRPEKRIAERKKLLK